MNDETIFDQNAVKEEKQGNEPLNNDETILEEQHTPMESEVPTEKKRKGFGTAGIAGAAGLAGAAIGVLTPVNVFPDVSEESEDITGDLEPEIAPSASGHLQGHGMPVATGVNDAMSFNQAFAAARHEVGPGGIFVWHGHTYGTYYANEWNAMSEAEHDQYWADVHHTTSNIEYQPAATSGTHSEVPPVSTEQHQEQETESIQHQHHDAETLELQEEDVLGVIDVNDDGQVDAAFVNANDNDTPDIILDSTGDGQFDTLILDPEVDENGEMVINENSVYEIDGVNIAASGTENPTEPINPVEGNTIVLNEGDVYEAVDLDDDGQVDALIVDANGNETLDLVVDTSSDGKMDTLILDPGVDENGNLVINENNITNINDVIITPDETLENPDTEFIAENQDIDETAYLLQDPDIPIDNHMDMVGFVG